jgi:hypothetical protein
LSERWEYTGAVVLAMGRVVRNCMHPFWFVPASFTSGIFVLLRSSASSRLKPNPV